MFLLFPVTPLLKGNFLAGGRNNYIVDDPKAPAKPKELPADFRRKRGCPNFNTYLYKRRLYCPFLKRIACRAA